MVSGLSVNLPKTRIFGINLKSDFVYDVANVLFRDTSTLSFKFLGVVVGDTPRRKELWVPLLTKFKNCLSAWKGSHISLGGKIVLLNSIFGESSNLPIFLLQGSKNHCERSN